MISTAFLDAERFPGLEALDFESNSLYSLLKQHYNVEISGGHEKLSITYCDAQEAGYLEMEEGDYPFGVHLLCQRADEAVTEPRGLPGRAELGRYKHEVSCSWR